MNRYEGMDGWAGITFLLGEEDRHTVITPEMFNDVSLFEGDTR